MSTVAYYEPNQAERRLVDALRSGRYEQGRDYLERNGKLCCLGVACRESACEVTTWQRIENAGTVTVFGPGRYTCGLPPQVRDELGWRSSDGMLRIDLRYGPPCPLSLSLLNDDGFSFDQIADVIEAGLVVRVEDRR